MGDVDQRLSQLYVAYTSNFPLHVLAIIRGEKEVVSVFHTTASSGGHSKSGLELLICIFKTFMRLYLCFLAVLYTIQNDWNHLANCRDKLPDGLFIGSSSHFFFLLHHLPRSEVF